MDKVEETRHLADIREKAHDLATKRLLESGVTYPTFFNYSSSEEHYRAILKYNELHSAAYLDISVGLYKEMKKNIVTNLPKDTFFKPVAVVDVASSNEMESNTFYWFDL